MEDLQALWNKAARAEQPRIDRETLQRIISRKSNNELSKFRRVVIFELIFTIIIVGALVALGVVYEDLIWHNSLLALFCGLLCLFYGQTLRQYRHIHVEDDLKAYLCNATAFLKKYIRQYILISWTGGLVGFLIGFYLQHDEEGRWGTGMLQSFSLAQWGIFLSICLLSLPFAYLYIKKLYQKRLENLQQLLNELREE
jgi:ABC-type phosphate/phosphonate transport system permease subunit